MNMLGISFALNEESIDLCTTITNILLAFLLVIYCVEHIDQHIGLLVESTTDRTIFRTHSCANLHCKAEDLVKLRDLNSRQPVA